MINWFYIVGWIPTVLAIVGNVLVVIAIVARKRLHTAPNCFVMSLAVADFCVGVLYFPTIFYCSYLSLCTSTIAFDFAVLVIYLSNTNLCAMVVDRYIAIVHPLRYTVWMSRRRVAIFIAMAWIFPITVDFLPALCARLGKCDMRNKGVVFMRLILFEILPCLFLLITTVQIIRTARRHMRQDAILQAQLRFNQPSRRRTREPSSATVIVTVVAIFLVCYSVEMYSVLRFIIDTSIPTQEVVHVIAFLVLINSAANPLAYAVFKKDIKKELKLLLFFNSRRHLDINPM